MGKPISLFLMDVTNSSKFKDMETLTHYLRQIVDWIHIWTRGVVCAKAKHRHGDEIILVSDHFSTAYIIASFISRFWTYKGYEPYFGLSFGYIDKSVAEIDDIEGWNNPLVKLARTSLELSKDKENRTWMRIDSNAVDQQFVKLINAEAETFELLRSLQTKNQRLVCDLYFLFQRQVDVAKFVDKTPATVSSQLKYGRCDRVLKSNQLVESSLSFMELYRDDLDVLHFIDPIAMELRDNIREFMKSNLDIFINLDNRG